MGLFDKLFGKSKNTEINNTADASDVSAPTAVTQTSTEPKPKKSRKPRVKKEQPKPEKPKTEEPRVTVLGFDFDPKNPSMGSMELDWNAEFIAMLRRHGYRGVNPEDLVDAWLNDVARNILNSNEQNPPNLDNSRYVTRTDLGDGRSEFK
jgi:hypothetical protein